MKSGFARKGGLRWAVASMCSVAGIAAIAASERSLAQQAQANEEEEIEEVVVTAKSRVFGNNSEITRAEDGFVVIERDNRTGDFGQIKRLVYFSDHALKDRIVTRSEKKVYDLLPDLNSTNGWITDKPEGVALTPSGEIYVVTDNDGVEDWSGETWFLRLGDISKLFE